MKNCSRLLMTAFLLGAATLSPPPAWTADTAAKSDARPERLIDAKTVLSGLTALADHRIGDMAGALTVISESQQVQSLDWNKMKPLLDGVEKHFGPATVWFAQPDGTYYSVDKGLIEQKLTDRPYFAKVLAGETSIGDLVVSRSTGGNTVITAVPIKKDGKVIGILGASMYLDKLAEEIKASTPLPNGFVFFALDTKGQIALHTKEERIFKEAVQLGGPSLGEAVRQMLASRDGVVAYEFEGRQQKAIFQTSPVTGWKFAIRFPAEEQK